MIGLFFIAQMTNSQLRSFSFDGGLGYQFVSALRQVTSEPIIYAESHHIPDYSPITKDDIPVKSLRIQFRSDQQLMQMLHGDLGEIAHPDLYLGLNGGRLDQFALMQNNTKPYYNVPPYSDKEIVDENGYVSTQGVVRVITQVLPTFKWSKSLSIDQQYAPIILDISAKHVREEVFFRCLAQALGADLAESVKNITLTPNVKDFKQLASNSFGEQVNMEKDELFKAKDTAASLFYDTVSDQLLTKLFTDHKDQEVSVASDSEIARQISIAYQFLSIGIAGQPGGTSHMHPIDPNSPFMELRYLCMPLCCYTYANKWGSVQF